MKVGDYVRTQNRIFKITKLNDEYIGIDGTEYKLHYGKMTKDYYFLLDDYDNFETQTIYKSSPNIIDLIEIGDYVNGSKVQEIGESYVEIEEYSGLNNDMPCIVKADDVKSIVTKEQFEAMQYKVGE